MTPASAVSFPLGIASRPIFKVVQQSHADFIPEILDGILSSVRRSDLVATALTCHRWSEVALDCLWKDLNGLIPLLNTYAPLVEDDNSDYWVRYVLSCIAALGLSVADRQDGRPIRYSIPTLLKPHGVDTLAMRLEYGRSITHTTTNRFPTKWWHTSCKTSSKTPRAHYYQTSKVCHGRPHEWMVLCSLPYGCHLPSKSWRSSCLVT